MGQPVTATSGRRPGAVALWTLISILGAGAVGGIAVSRGETINSLWFIVAAVCVYAVGYRFYSAFIAAKVLALDPTRATPAERLNDGRDFVLTNKWVVFGHHFAAIAGPGPLIGPPLAAQFGYLPGAMWILIGAVLGGCVQDFVTLFFSTRRNARSLGQMARDELGPLGGVAALIGVMMIMIILIAVLGLVVGNAMKHSPWATSTVAATIPIAILIGLYMRHIRPGRVLEGTLIGIALLLLAVASVMLRPEVQMPALTHFIDGTCPIFGGTLFPFVFITIACGAISGFHALIASGTTPKLITNERDIRFIGYGGMMMESFVAIMAMIAATVLDPGVFFAINSPAGVVGASAAAAVAKISSWGFPVTVEQMEHLAKEMGESTLFGRTGGAPSLAVGMASIFAQAFGEGMLAMWYHFAIMFEALFILTTLDAGTRVGRFMLQDLLGNVVPALGRTSWYPSVLFTSACVVAAWGYFLYMGTIDPLGGINSLWPLFGIANQMLAAIALCVGTTILVKSGKLRYAWITAAPLAWLVVITSTAAWEKLFSSDVRVGFLTHARDHTNKNTAGALPPDKLAAAPHLIFNDRLDAALTAFFFITIWVLVLDMLRVCARALRGRIEPPLTEAPHVPSRLVEDWVRD